MEVFNPNSNINFLGWRKVSLAISLALIIISLGAIFTRGLNYALDFTGGVLVEAEYKDPVETADVRAALEAAGFGDALVQSIGGSREVAIRLRVDKASEAGASKAATAADKQLHHVVACHILDYFAPGMNQAAISQCHCHSDDIISNRTVTKSPWSAGIDFQNRSYSQSFSIRINGQPLTE